MHPQNHDLISPVPIPPETLTQLYITPWTHSILNNPQKYIPIAHPSRVPKPSEDSFLAKTLATPDTFPIWQTFYKPSDPNFTSTSTSTSTSQSSPNQPINSTSPNPNPNPNPTPNPNQPPPGSDETIYIIHLSTGLNGHAFTLHGGATTVILDELLGHMARVYSNPSPSRPIYTAFLNTTFLQPIRTPGAVLGRAWMVREKCGGRKFWVRGVLEDGMGEVTAVGEALMVESRGEKL